MHWSAEIRSLYLSGAANQFILHGNVEDTLVFPPGEGDGESPRLGQLTEFLLERQLRKFDLVFIYDLGQGLRAISRTPEGARALQDGPSALAGADLPKRPREAVAHVDHVLRHRHHLDSAGKGSRPGLGIAVIIRTASLALPARAAAAGDFEINSAASLVRSWAVERPFLGQNFVSILVAEHLADLHPLVAGNPRTAVVAIPLPTREDLEVALRAWNESCPVALGGWAGREGVPAERLLGASLASVESLVRRRQHEGVGLDEDALTGLRKELVERECQGLIEFIESPRTLDDFRGGDAVKEWLREDLALWRADDRAGLPMGYLVSGPVGTGKTFLVECLAGEAKVPVVKLRNFRDKWVGSTEGNLERIFALLRALGRCFVFIDEADQALGTRSAGSGDSGTGGRVYAMMAKEMGDSRNRGRIVWVLASSRPDLIEVDLKRPGRIDVRLPLFPTVDRTESYALIRDLCRQRGLELTERSAPSWGELMPEHVTPGAAESIAVKVYRLVRARGLQPHDALGAVLADYADPVPVEVMRFQIGLAAQESSEPAFVPEVFRTPEPEDPWAFSEDDIPF